MCSTIHYHTGTQIVKYSIMYLHAFSVAIYECLGKWFTGLTTNTAFWCDMANDPLTQFCVASSITIPAHVVLFEPVCTHTHTHTSYVPVLLIYGIRRKSISSYVTKAWYPWWSTARSFQFWRSVLHGWNNLRYSKSIQHPMYRHHESRDNRWWLWASEGRGLGFW